MWWSGSSLMSAVRAGIWGFLLFAGTAWLALGWSVLRLEPADIAGPAGAVILFGALTEAVRALAGSRTWWLNAGMAALFAITGVLLLADRDSTVTTPAALIGWYLMVRGAADVAVSMMTRETDRIWGLLTVLGVVQTGLGLFAASPWSRTGELVTTVLGALGVLRGIADLVAALRLREAAPVTLELPPERAAGVSGYTAGVTDYDAAPRRTGPRHRAPSRTPGIRRAGVESFHDEVLRTTADLDAMLALAGVTGAAVGASRPEPDEDLPAVPDTPEGVEAMADDELPRTIADTAEIRVVSES